MPSMEAGTAGPLDDARFAALYKLPFFADASDAAMNRLRAHAVWRTYPADTVVIEHGDKQDRVFFIVEGVVRVIVRTPLGYEAILNELNAGDFFGEMAAIDGVQRSANVSTLSRAHLCSFPGPAFLDFALNTPCVARRLLTIMSGRLRAKDERLIELGALNVRERLIAELLRLSRDRGGGERVLSPPPAQHVLASRIGTRRESVSRELAELSRAGLLSLGRQAIVLHCPDRLRAEVDARLRGS
jgi:CRP/FNR family transcriptional regulator, cyclic AMP receptor protein